MMEEFLDENFEEPVLETIDEDYATDGTQTPDSLTWNTPRKSKLRYKIKNQKRKIDRLHSSRVRPTASPIVSFDEFLKTQNIALPDTLKMIISTQLDLHKANCKARRYSDAFKMFALTTYFFGPKVYRMLSFIFKLPTYRSLTKITEKWPSNPGLNPIIFEALQFKIKNFADIDKNCSLCIDEMSLKSHLFYNISKDQVIGYDTVTTDNLKPAKNVLVIMVQGIAKKWKQPLAYFFINTTFPATELKAVIIKTIENLQDIGLFVRVLISDQGSNFISLSNLLNVTVEKPYFIVNKTKIYYIFDTPHLLKSLRNNFIKYYIKFNDRTTSFEHVKTFYEKDCTLAIKSAPKLTNRHIYPNSFQKMNVSYAAQLMSHSVAAAMCVHLSFGALPKSAAATIELIEKGDKLFDMLNSNFNFTKTERRPYKGEADQDKFLEEMCKFFKNLKMFNKAGDEKTKKIKCIRGWQITIRSVMLLFKELQACGFKYLLTRRLNQDALENMFGYARQQGGNALGPTPIQFSRAFKKLVGLKFFHCSSNTNCEEDNVESLKLFSDWSKLDLQKSNLFTKSKINNLQFPTAQNNVRDYHDHNFPQENALSYFSGYLFKKCLDIHECYKCSSSVQTQILPNNLLCLYKAYNDTNSKFGSLIAPPINFVDYIENLEKIFQNIFKSNSTKQGVGVLIFDNLKAMSHSFILSCKNFPIEFLLKLFVRIRIYFTLKFQNNNFKNVQNKRKLQNLQHV